MITRPQQVLIKRAQKEAGLDDDEYRDALQTVCGCRSSTDPKMTDRALVAYLEAIYWRKVDLGQLQRVCKAGAVFQERGHWVRKNTNQETSRDRYSQATLGREIDQLGIELGRLGFGEKYCAGIRANVIQDRTDAHSLHKYKAALARTLAAKRRATEAEPNPF